MNSLIMVLIILALVAEIVLLVNIFIAWNNERRMIKLSRLASQLAKDIYEINNSKGSL